MTTPVLFPLWFLLCSALFLALFRLLRFPWIHRGEEIFFSAAAALGGISLTVLLLGSLGQARLSAFCAAAAATGLAAVPLLLSARRRPAPARIPRPGAYALCALVLLFFPYVFIPPFFYDTLHYHYGLPSLFLRSGSTSPIPWIVESHFPLGVEMAAMAGMADGSYLGANLVNFVFFALCGLGILCLSDRLGERRAGWIGLLLFLAAPGAVSIFFVQKSDLGTTLFFLAFLYALLLCREEPSGRRFPLLAGAFAGLALGTKYTAVPFTAIAVLLALAPPARGAAPVLRLRQAVPFLLAAAAVYAPWPARDLAATGNPVYPLLNGIFGSPTWSPDRMRLLAGDAHPFSAMYGGLKDAGRLFLSATFFPDMGIGGIGASLGAGIAGALLHPIFVRKPGPNWAFLRNAALASLVAWFFTSWFSRFLLPVLPVMVLLTGALLGRVAAMSGRLEKTVLAAALALLVGGQIASAAASSRQVPLFRAWKSALRMAGHPERGMQVLVRLHGTANAALFANRFLLPSSRILFVGETRPYYFQQDVVVPSAFDEHPLQRIATAGRLPERIRGDLAALGFTHVLVSWPEWERLSASYYRLLWKEEDRKAAASFLRGLPAVFGDRSATIYSLEKARADAVTAGAADG